MTDEFRRARVKKRRQVTSLLSFAGDDSDVGEDGDIDGNLEKIQKNSNFFFVKPSLNLLTDGGALDNRALIFGERRFFLVKNQRETK